MRLSALPLLSLIALPMTANGLPTIQSTTAQLADDVAGLYAASPFYAALYVNGGCSPNFGKTVTLVRIYDGYRCRFFRYVMPHCYFQVGF